MNDFIKVAKVFSKAVKFWVYQQSLNEEKAKVDLEKQAEEYKATHKKLTAAMEEAKSRSSALTKRIDVLSRTNTEQKKELSDLHTRYCELVRQKRKLEELYSTLKESSNTANSMSVEVPAKRSENDIMSSGDSEHSLPPRPQSLPRPPPPSRPRQNLFSSHSEFVLRSPQTPKMKPLNFSVSDDIGFSPRKQESFSMFETSPQKRAAKFSFHDLQQMNPRQPLQNPGSPTLKPLSGDRFNIFKRRENKFSVSSASLTPASASSPSSPRVVPFNKK